MHDLMHIGTVTVVAATGTGAAHDQEEVPHHHREHQVQENLNRDRVDACAAYGVIRDANIEVAICPAYGVDVNAETESNPPYESIS